MCLEEKTFHNLVSKPCILLFSKAFFLFFFFFVVVAGDTQHCTVFEEVFFLEKNVDEPGSNQMERQSSWQQAKHAKLYFNHLILLQTEEREPLKAVNS